VGASEPDKQKNISVASAMLRWWRDGIRHKGFGATARTFLTELRDFVRESTPERRRQRYGDIDYDWEHRVDTTEATVSFRNRLLGVFHSAYQPTEPEAFHQMMRALPIDCSQFVFIDLGSGKGRTLLMASDYPFRRVIGVELFRDLHHIALQNISKYKGGLGDRVQSICVDARQFDFPADPSVLFLFNPFPKQVLEDVLGRLAQSLQNFPRVIYVIYHNPVLESVLAAYPGMRMIQRQDHYSIFAIGM
jgi:hypothetical protein